MTGLMARSRSSLTEARVLLNAGLNNGAISRAYYAMFFAARAALRSIDPDLEQAKTHGTLLRRFSRHVIKEQGADPRLSSMIRKAFDLRQRADYEEPDVSLERTEQIVTSAEEFVAIISAFIETRVQ